MYLCSSGMKRESCRSFGLLLLEYIYKSRNLWENMEKRWLWIGGSFLLIFAFLFYGTVSYLKVQETSQSQETRLTGLSIGASVDISSCQTLSLADTSYVLLNNVSSVSGNCFTMTANNITLDCRGYAINYSYSGRWNDKGVYISGVNQTVVKNCLILDGADNGSNRPGLHILNANNGTFKNNTFFTFGNSSEGIRLESTVGYSDTNYNLIQDNRIVTFGNKSDGIAFIDSSASNNVTGNKITVSTSDQANGIFLNFDIDNSIFDNNTITMSSPVTGNTRAFYLSASSNFNRISNMTIVTSNTNGFGLQVQSNGDNVFENISITTSGSSASGIRVLGITNTTFKNMYVTTSGSTARGLNILGTSSFEVIDSVLKALNPGSSDIRITGAVNGGEWNLTNVSFNTKSWVAGLNGTLNVHWYLDALARFTNGSNAPGANITAQDITGAVPFSALTGNDGRISRKSLLAYQETNGSGGGFNVFTFYSNYTFTAEAPVGGETFVQSWNMTMNRDLLFLFTPLGGKVAFTPPTPSDQALVPQFLLNASVGEPFDTVFFALNGANTTLYDPTLFFMFNFNNLSSLGENDTFVRDLGSKRMNLTFNGSSAPSEITSDGRFFGGIRSGSSDNTVWDGEDIDVLNNITITAWVNISGTQLLTGNHTIITKSLGCGIADGEWLLFIRGSDSLLRFNCGGTLSVVPGVNISKDQWNFIALTFNDDTDTATLYANGMSGSVVINTDTCLVDSLEPIHVADQSGCAVKELNGTLDELRVWNRILTPLEIREQEFSHLYKNNETQWYFSRNQGGLQEGAYTYQLSTLLGIQQFFDQRALFFGSFPAVNFVDPTPVQGANSSSGSVAVNVSISEVSLKSVNFSWNGTKIIPYDSSLVLMMNFDNLSSLGENDTFVADVSRYSNNGTVFGALASAFGKYGSAFTFDGVDDYIDLGNPASLNQDFTQLSLEFWMYAFSTTGSDAGLVGKGATVYGTTYHNNSYVYFYIQGANGNFTSAPVNQNQWNHVVGVYNGTSVILYINGVKMSEEGGIVSSTGIGGAFSVGRYPLTGVVFNGTLDGVRVWNRSLNALEVSELYVSHLFKYAPDQWSLSVLKTGLADGNYSYFACAADVLGSNCTETRTVSLSTTLPSLFVTINQPQNITYNSFPIPFNVTLNQAGDTCLYGLDGNVNVSMQKNGVTDFNSTNNSMSEGSHMVRYYCNDTLGNNNFSTLRVFSINTTIPTPPGPGPGPSDGGGGGGAGGPPAPASKTYYFPQSSWEVGARAVVTRREIVKINFQNVNYSFTVTSLNKTLVVFSGYQDFTLTNSQKLDLNRDGIFDLSFSLEGVANTTAQIFVQKVQPVSSPLPVKNVSEEPLEENKTPSAQNAPSAFKKSLAVYWTVIVLLVALIALIGAILGVLYHIRRKRGGNHQLLMKGNGGL